METERIVRDYIEQPMGDGMTRLVPFPPIQVFQFEKRPMPRKSHKNVIVTVFCSIASFFAGASLIGMAVYPLLSALIFICSIGFILLVLYANTGHKRE